VNRVGLGVDRIYEGLLRLVRIYRATLQMSLMCSLSFLLKHMKPLPFLWQERDGKAGFFDLEDLILCESWLEHRALIVGRPADALQLSEEEAAEKLVRLRERGYLVVRGRGRGASYDLKRDLCGSFAWSSQRGR